MTSQQPPEWATAVPWAPVAQAPGKAFQVTQVDTETAQAMRSQLLQSIWQGFLQIVDGFLLPGDPSNQLAQWIDDLHVVEINASKAWQNWVTSLQDMDANAVALIKKWVSDVLVPAGGLTSSTNIPPHLFTRLGPSVLTNLLPDGGFNKQSSVVGDATIVWDGTVDHTGTTGSGSVRFTANGTQQYMLGVPIQVVAGQEVELICYTTWSGVTAASGNGICLAVKAYDANDNLISDPDNWITDAVADPPATSVGATGLVDTNSSSLTPDANGWVQLVGFYTTPTDCKYVRLCLDVESSVAAGSIWFDDCTAMCPLVDAALIGNIENIGQIPPANVGSSGGIGTTIDDTLKTMWSNLSAALGNVGDGSGGWLSQLLGTLSTNWDGAHSLSVTHQNILATVNNRPVSAGVEETVESNINYTGASATALPAVTQASYSLGTWIRISQAKTFTFLQWAGAANALMTSNALYINFYKYNPATQGLTWLFTSSNQASTLTTTYSWQLYNIPTPDVIACQAGDLIGIEWQVIGSSTPQSLQLGGTPLPLGAHPTAQPPSNSFSQNWGSSAASSIASGSINWGQKAYVPYAGLGVGTLPATFMAPVTISWTSAGSYTSGVGSDGNTYTNIPSWARYIDIIVVGDGGSGGIGAGGSGNAGSGSSLTVGTHSYTGTGGVRGQGGKTYRANSPGLSPGNVVVNGNTYFGGTQVNYQQAGSAPGGGGGGGYWIGFYGWGGGGGDWAYASGLSVAGGEAISCVIGPGGAGNEDNVGNGPGAPGAAFLVIRQS